METKHKLMPPLLLLGFSLFLCISLPSCDKEYREDYTFRNQLNDDVIFTVFSDNDLLDTLDGIEIKLGAYEQILLLVNVSDSPKNGAGANYISNLADSISVKIANADVQIVMWRKGGENFHESNFTHLRDIFDPNEAPWRFKSIDNNHVEYYYLLTQEE